MDSRSYWLADGYRYKPVEDQSASKQYERDNFILHPKDDPKTYVEYSIGAQSQEDPQRANRAFRRIKSASAVRLCDRPWTHKEQLKYPVGFVQRSRPASAIICTTRSSLAVQTSRRIKSAGPRKTFVSEEKTRVKLDELRMGFTLCNKLYENEYKSVNVHLHPAGPAPDYRYFDRHARCYNHLHAHLNRFGDRPQRAWEKFLETCGSRATSPARPDDPNVQPQRYIDYHRPRTAPGMARGSYTLQFSNFVQQIQLHSKQITTAVGTSDSNLGEDKLILESAEENLIRKYRKPSDTRSNGTEGRPVSPSSIDNDCQHEEGKNHQPVAEVAGTGQQFIPEEEAIQTMSDNMSLSPLDKVRKDTELEKISSSTDWDNNKDRAPSPRQPPPSPEPVKKPTVQEIPLSVVKRVKQRGCIKPKTKKPFEKIRTTKKMEENKETFQLSIEKIPPDDIPVIESIKENAQLDLTAPGLPLSKETEKEPQKENNKPKQHLIELSDDIFKPDYNDLLNEQLWLNRPEFNWSNMETNGVEDVKRQPQVKSWIAGRLALSQQASRFELPMDMRNLETMTPQEYIKTHCIITSRRQSLYQKIFVKNKDKSHTNTILYKDIDKSLKDVLVNTVNSEQIQEVLKTLEIDEHTKIDYKLFAGMAAFTERVLYQRFVTDDTQDIPEYQKEKIECADFCALKWKFHGIHVNPPMAKLLEQLT